MEENLFPSSRFVERTSLKSVKDVLDHLGQFYICVYFFKVIVKLDVDAGRFVGRFSKRLGSKAGFASKPVCIQRKKENDKKTVG